MTAHSPLVGGSSAERLLNCPGSYHLIMNVPPMPDVASEAANEGTAAHAVMETLLLARQADSTTDLRAEARVWLGSTFHDRELSEESLDTLIEPAIEALLDLETSLGGGFKVMAVEQTFNFPGIPSAFGTIDLILQSDTHVLICDYKFGSYEVTTTSVDEAGNEYLNPQLAFYGCAALAGKPRWFNGREIAVAVIQPRSERRFEWTLVERIELKDFAGALVAVVAKALGHDVPLKRGKWCRYCPAKPTCPEWTGPLLDLTVFGTVALEPQLSGDKKRYGEVLAEAKDFAELASDYAKEVDRQLAAFLNDGGSVPGWGLAPKTKLRQWVDEPLVADALRGLGFAEDQIWQRKLVTFGSADATAKRRGVKIPENLRVAPISNEMVPARVAVKLPTEREQASD